VQEWGLHDKFGLAPTTVKNWLQFVMSKYADNSYHNATHAADVLQAIHYMLRTGGAAEHLSDLQIFALLLAAMMHDVDHDGLTNAFHKQTRTERALAANDQSVQENHHLRVVFERMARDPAVDVLSGLDAAQHSELRRLLILLILSTDMSKHFSLLQNARRGDAAGPPGPEERAEWAEALMCFLLHAADISGQARPPDLALTWAGRCFAELYAQGDREKALGLPASPQCDRATTVVSSAQIGFVTFVVRPTFELLAALLPAAAADCLPPLEQNLARWRRREDAAVQLQAPGAGGSSPIAALGYRRQRRRSSAEVLNAELGRVAQESLAGLLKRVSSVDVSPAPPPALTI
jgi:hypothetical protein